MKPEKRVKKVREALSALSNRSEIARDAGLRKAMTIPNRRRMKRENNPRNNPID